MVTICSSLEKKVNYLSKLPISIGNHTKTLKRAALKLGCKVEKISDNGESVTKHMMYNSYGFAEALYRLKSARQEAYFTVKYRVYRY